MTIQKIKKLLNDGNEKIVVEGIRSHHEVELFKENFESFMIVSVFASPITRFERLKIRMREDDSQDYDGFLERDYRELGFGLGNVISLSDKMIINESDLESYYKKIKELLNEIDF